MDARKIIMFFYIIYTGYLLVICGVTSIALVDMIPAIVLLWMMYVAFVSGGELSKKVCFFETNRKYINTELSSRVWITVSLLAIPFAILAAKYYTGLGPMQVINNLLNGVSNYYYYQFYFANSGIATVGLAKIPYVLMLSWVKASMIYGCVRIFFYEKCKILMKIIMFGVCVAPHIYIAMARGTNFEFYEFTILMIFLVLSKITSSISIKKISINAIVALVMCFVFGVVLIAVYCSVLEARGYAFNVKISKDICYDENAFLVQLAPGLSFVMVNLFSYLGFGMFYIASFVNEVWFSSLNNFLAGFLVKGYESITGISTNQLMKDTIDMGVRWHPDFVNSINEYGIVVTFVLIVLIGYFSRMLYMRGNDVWVYMAEYFIVLQMLSFPVGNFIMSSSANKLLIIMIVFFLILGKKKGDCCGQN